MTLIINNHDVEALLTMEMTLEALEESYLALARQEAVCRPRIDIRIPTSDPSKNYQWGTMEGGSTAGYFAIRMKSDVIYETEYNGAVTQEKYCVRPGLFCGLILLTSIENGEPIAFLNEGTAAIAGRRRWRHRRQVHGQRGCRGGRHARLRRHGAHPYAGVHARAHDQEAAGVQPD
jgi:hypothetical protein